MTIHDHGSKSEQEPRTTCIQCGTCCNKGGPALHLQDMDILRNGVIGPQHLFTLRKGEKVYENVQDAVVPLDAEMVKLKGKPGSWACLFFDGDSNSCTIYENRPIECRALACWDTTALEAVYNKDRMTRENLVGPEDAVRKFMDAHEARCSYEELARLAKIMGTDYAAEEAGQILAMMDFEHKMRAMLVEKAGLQKEHLDFLFGRPMIETIRGYGLEVKNIGGKLMLAPVGNP